MKQLLSNLLTLILGHKCVVCGMRYTNKAYDNVGVCSKYCLGLYVEAGEPDWYEGFCPCDVCGEWTYHDANDVCWECSNPNDPGFDEPKDE